MKLSVVTLLHLGRHGDELTVHPSEDAAKDALFATDVKPHWDNAFCTDGAACGVDGCTGVPASPDGLTRDDAIALYFAHRTGTETYDLVNHDVELPADDVVAALGGFLRDTDLVQREHILAALNDTADDSRIVTVDLPGLFDNRFATSMVAKGEPNHGGPWSLHRAYTHGEVIAHGRGTVRRLTFRLSDAEDCCNALVEEAELYLRTDLTETPAEKQACRVLIGRCQLVIRQVRAAYEVRFPDH